MTGAERVTVPMGRTFQTDVGTFVRYEVDPDRITRRSRRTLDELVRVTAREMASQAGLRVLDVVSATVQVSGDVIVELRVERRP